MEKFLKENRLYVSLGAVGIFLLIMWILNASQGNKIREMLTVPVQKGELTVKVSEVGELVAQDQATISAINDKQILFLAPEGSWAEPGDTLVVFESEKYKLYTDEARSAVKVAQAELQQAINEMEAQRQKEEAKHKEYQSLLQLSEKGYVVESEVEQARLGYLEMQARTRSLLSVVEARKADVERSESSMRNSERKLTQSVMTAPREGIVVYATVGSGNLARKVQVGMVPFEGQDLMYLPDVGSMLVKSEINEVDLDKVRLGQPVEIRLDAFPGAVFNGQVENIGTLARRKVNPATGNTTSTKVFDLTVKVAEKDKRLKPGLSATIDIIVDKLSEVLYIPIESVFTTESNRNYVFLKAGNSSIEKRLLEIGKSNDLYVEVRNGLVENDIVLLTEPTKE